NALLDTCGFLYWASGDARLPARVRAILDDADNKIFFSAASAMEIVLKQHSGKLTLPEPAEIYVPKKLAEFEFEMLDIKVAHALHVSSMEWKHKDPFDLLILSQCILLKIPVLSDDGLFEKYPVTVIWK